MRFSNTVKTYLKITGCTLAGLLLAIIILGIIGLFDDGAENLGGGYSYYDDISNGAILGPEIDIPPFVANFSYDKRFIIAKQVMYGSNPERIFSECNEYNYPSLTGDYYWIIDKQAQKYFGPLTLEGFTTKCDSLNVKIKLLPQNERKPRVKP